MPVIKLVGRLQSVFIRLPTTFDHHRAVGQSCSVHQGLLRPLLENSTNIKMKTLVLEAGTLAGNSNQT